MCLAIPGKIKAINGRRITVEYPGEQREVIDGGIPVKVGDFVLIQMGITIKKIPEKQAKISWKAWSKIGN